MSSCFRSSKEEKEKQEWEKRFKSSEELWERLERLSYLRFNAELCGDGNEEEILSVDRNYENEFLDEEKDRRTQYAHVRQIGDETLWRSCKFSSKEFTILLFFGNDIHSFEFNRENATYTHTSTVNKFVHNPPDVLGRFDAVDAIDWDWQERLGIFGSDLEI